MSPYKVMLFARGTRNPLRLALLLMLLAGLGLSLYGQGASRPQVPVSDLARRNLSLVGAPASQIEPVLRTNPGLLLELKELIARQAADEGRILTDADVADSNIFDQLR